METAQFREGLRARDPECWAHVVAQYSGALHRQVRVLLPARLDPENALGEVWLRALKAARRYDPTRPPYAWLARICVNVCLNVRRHERRLRFLPSGPERVAPDDDVPPADRGELRRLLRCLPHRQAEVLALRFVFGVPTAEIAPLLDVEVSSVKKHLLRGVRGLRELRANPPLEALDFEISDRKPAS